MSAIKKFDRASLDASTPILPSFSSYEELKHHFEDYPAVWNSFLKLPPELQKELLGFCMGEHGLKITYDPVFRRVFHPAGHPERLESFLSALLERKIRIIDILPRQGIQLAEKGSFVIIDVLVQLDDGAYANVEMQKFGYQFPLARADCYSSDIIMRQYEWKRAELGTDFGFHKLQKVYCIILMEQSPLQFHDAEKNYIHKRSSSFNTGIFPNNSGLHEEFFICLDIFHSNVDNITKYSTVLDAWLTFFSANSLDEMRKLVKEFPMFLPIYQEIAEFVKEPEELMNMFSEALYIMDRNAERLMVSELQNKVDELKASADAARAERIEVQAERDAAQMERDIFRMCLGGKSPDEIATDLFVTIERVKEVLDQVNQGSQI